MGTRITTPRKEVEIAPGAINLVIHQDGRRFPLKMPERYAEVKTRVFPVVLMRLKGVENEKGEKCIINSNVRLVWMEFLNIFHNKALADKKPEYCSISEVNLARAIGLRSPIVVREAIAILHNLGILKMTWETERCKNNKGEWIDRRVNVRYLDVADPSGELAKNWPDNLKII